MGGRNSRGGWTVTAYPQVGEASAVFRSGRGGGGESAAAAPDGEDSQVRAARRARTVIRRYLVANRLRYMWVLTFKTPVFQHVAAAREVAAFVAELKATFPEVGAYLYSGEPHPGGHGWHVNLFVGVRLPWADVGRIWGRGFVYVTDWARRGRKDTSLRERVRAGARYAAKYAAKSLEELAEYGCERLDGEHRYERGQGFDARVVQHSAVSLADVHEQLSLMARDGYTVERWLSDDPDWRGPPLLWVCWQV